MASIQKLRSEAAALEEEADIMEVRWILGLATDRDVTAAREAAARARNALEAASRKMQAPERSS